MNGKSTLVLLMTVVLVGLFIVLFERNTDSTRTRMDHAGRAFYFNPDSVTAIEVSSDGVSFECRREKSGWTMKKPAEEPADGGAVDELLYRLSTVSRGETITPAQLAARNLHPEDFGLDRPRVRIAVTDAGRTSVYLLGASTPLGNALYAAVEGHAEVFTADGGVLDVLPADADLLRSRRLFHEERSKVRQIAVHREEGFLQVERDKEGRWLLRQPVTGRADRNRIYEWLDALFKYEISDFTASETGDASAYGLTDSQLQITLTFNGDDSGSTLILGRATAENPRLIYARRAAGRAVYAVPAALADLLRVKEADWRERRLLPLAPHEINGIRMGSGSDSIVLSRSAAGRWMVGGLQPVAADPERVGALLNAWASAEIVEFNDAAGTNLAVFGLAPEKMRVSFLKNPDRPESAFELLVGSLPPEDGRVWVRAVTEKPLYRIPSEVIERISLDRLFYRNREVLTTDPARIRSITLKGAGREETLQMDSVTGKFAPVRPRQDKPDELAVQKVLVSVSRLVAGRFVAEDPADLNRYGLAPPADELTIGLAGQDGISKTLMLGNESEDGGFYAMIKGQDIIFTLDREIRDAAFPATLFSVPPAGETP
ncbi:MAG TPA: DUF4340 domain-containing protein [Kiritimatiellia bacterium]|nr:DUF4340 domain-containing protein [Kiritimatiellia bacterium]HNS80172.1 DUF4340 domain-containing protein [Kiritimatiellia bacterium]